MKVSDDSLPEFNTFDQSNTQNTCIKYHKLLFKAKSYAKSYQSCKKVVSSRFRNLTLIDDRTAAAYRWRSIWCLLYIYIYIYITVGAFSEWFEQVSVGFIYNCGVSCKAVGVSVAFCYPLCNCSCMFWTTVYA